MERIYHHYEKWEDWKCGFYDNCTGEVKEELTKKVVEMFSSEDLTREFMSKVISDWPNSCEHNLTNEAMNKIAYIGQSACCIFGGVPNTVTMEAWSKLPKDVRDRADQIAEETLNTWINA